MHRIKKYVIASSNIPQKRRLVGMKNEFSLDNNQLKLNRHYHIFISFLQKSIVDCTM